MTTTPNLDALAAEFSAWRQHKNDPGQDPTTPNELKQKAVALRQHYSAATIVNTLKINHSALKKWTKAYQPAQEEQTQPEFIPVQLPSDSQITTPPEHHGVLTIQCDHQMNLVFHQWPPQGYLESILSQLTTGRQ